MKNNSRGFSIVETVVVVFIFGLIVVVIYTVYSNYSGVIGTQEALMDTAGSLSATMVDIEKSVNQADKVVSTHTFSDTTVTSTSTSLVVEMPAVDASGNIVTNIYDYIGYYATGTKAVRVVDAAASSSRQTSSRSFSQTLSALKFTYDNSDLTLVTNITVDATTSTVVKQKTITSHLKQTDYMRNI